MFHTTLGHDINALSCVGFIVTFQRGTEWAATGKVTQKVPAVFPTANVVAYRSDIAAMDPNYKYGLNALSNPPGAGRGGATARRPAVADAKFSRRQFALLAGPTGGGPLRLEAQPIRLRPKPWCQRIQAELGRRLARHRSRWLQGRRSFHRG